MSDTTSYEKHNTKAPEPKVVISNVSDARHLRTVTSTRGYQMQVVRSQDQQVALEELGYKQELVRKYSWFELFGVAFSIMGLLPSIGSTFYQAISAGMSGATWGWLIASFCGILPMGIGLAELGSAYPTASAVYLATWNWSPPKLRNFISYGVGFIDTLSLAASVCSITSGCSGQILSCVQLYKPNFVVTNGNNYGVYAACIVAMACIGSASSGFNAKVQTISTFSNGFLLILVFIALPIGTHHKGIAFNGGKEIFGNVENFSNWPKGWNWILNAFQPAVWTIGAFDSCIHMTEEARFTPRKPGRPLLLDPAASPAAFGIITSIVVCGLLGFLMLICLCACMGPSVADIYNSSYDEAITQIFMNSLGQKWTVAIMSLMCWGSFLMGASCMLATCRQFYAMARDYGIPTKFLSEYFAVVDEKLHVPVRAMWGSTALSLALGCMMFGGDACAAALFSLSICGMYMAIVVPMFLRLTYARKDFVPGPFYLGDFWSPFINWIGVLFQIFMIVIVCIPLVNNPDKTEMNYTVVIGPGFLLLGLIHYSLYQHKFYHGPCSNLSDEEYAELMVDENIDAIISTTSAKEKRL
ncbi:hypothetical protein ACO0QE_004104 [Hanseniaspora vineae]